MTGSHFIMTGSHFIVAGSHFIVAGSDFIVAGSDFLLVEYYFIMISSDSRVGSNHLIYSGFKNQMKGNIFCMSIPNLGHFLRETHKFLCLTTYSDLSYSRTDTKY